MTESPLLEALRSASDEGLLSIKFNVYGFKMDSTSPEFTLGSIVGSIGPVRAAEPARFVFGRHMMAASQVVSKEGVALRDMSDFVSSQFTRRLRPPLRGVAAPQVIGRSDGSKPPFCP